MRAGEPIHQLNKYYKKNPGFRKWVKANEQFFRQNPTVFEELVQDPNMVNLFIDVLMLQSETIKSRLSRKG